MGNIKDIRYYEVITVNYCCSRCLGHETKEKSYIYLVVKKSLKEDDWIKVPCSYPGPRGIGLDTLGIEDIQGRFDEFISYLNSDEDFQRLNLEDLGRFEDMDRVFWVLRYRVQDFLRATRYNNNNNNNNKVGE